MEADVYVVKKTERFDVRYFQWQEEQYIDVLCTSDSYQQLWSRLKTDPLLADQLSHIQFNRPLIQFWPIIDDPNQQLRNKDVIASTFLTIVVYSILAGIIYCIYVGLQILIRWLFT